MSSQVRDLMESLPVHFLPDKAGSAKARIQFDFAKDDNGQWVLEVADGRCETREEVASAPDAKLTMTGADFCALYENRLNAVQAFMGGKIKVTGNVGLVMQLLNWFDRT